MKTYIIIIAAVLAITIGCNSQKISGSTTDTATTANDTIRIANDSLEYEVIIIDPGFNTWLASRARPRGYYGQSYLENKNRFWVREWNSRTLDPMRWGDMYQMRIDYDQNINYGYEVNYLLYNYLVYFQLSNNQRLGGIVPQI